MRTWETALKIVKPLKPGPFFTIVAIEEVTDLITEIRNKRRIDNTLNSDDEVSLRLAMIRRFLLEKELSEQLKAG